MYTDVPTELGNLFRAIKSMRGHLLSELDDRGLMATFARTEPEIAKTAIGSVSGLPVLDPHSWEHNLLWLTTPWYPAIAVADLIGDMSAAYSERDKLVYINRNGAVRPAAVVDGHGGIGVVIGEQLEAGVESVGDFVIGTFGAATDIVGGVGDLATGVAKTADILPYLLMGAAYLKMKGEW